ncbi:hypothetical protein E0485_05850 [Paenibacillus albiflavus]|uniref:Uncharacterized protein n=1 Tax=Paenibacillus albiflavus TaxID=2545760 RepID=A0A4R4EH03_9BACL|nr:hypothetical protein [Paenibacillus albiflavus]TCZ79384.1 hypothetical protein E0485_05850 [Paenibacillus albiflavus]
MHRVLVWVLLIKYVLSILPTLLMFYILIELFPYTGLGRIVALPMIFVINTVIIACGLAISKKIKKQYRIVIWTGIIILTISISILSYPQESGPHIVTQTKHAVIAIENYENITKDDLEIIENSSTKKLVNPDERYVVALYKYKHELPLDGTYKMYQREPVYFYDSHIRKIDDIPAKLIGYHKVIWWYLKTFKD